MCDRYTIKIEKILEEKDGRTRAQRKRNHF